MNKNLVALVTVLLLTPGLVAANIETIVSNSPQSLALARYIGSLQRRDPFADSGIVGIAVKATLPKLYKEAEFMALRKPGENRQSEYALLLRGGDGTVAEEVIAPYLADDEGKQEPPLSTIAITPGDYKFRFAGSVKTGGGQAFVYQISPRKNRPGQISGEIWIDSATGREVMLTGRVKTSRSETGSADLVRDTTLLNGSAFVRVTHLTFSVRRLGCAELVITEYPLQSENGALNRARQY